MTEAEWLAATDPTPMLEHVRGKVSNRKRHLFACASWRRLLLGFPLPTMRAFVEAHQMYADGATTEEVAAALGDSWRGKGPLLELERSTRLAQTLANLQRMWTREMPTTPNPLRYFSDFFTRIIAPFGGDEAENAAQTDLVRHIFGNPFRSLPPADFSANIVRLAEAVYDGADCAFALHDALLDAGHVELAEHFRNPAHPKGCWLLDAILEKT